MCLLGKYCLQYLLINQFLYKNQHNHYKRDSVLLQVPKQAIFLLQVVQFEIQGYYKKIQQGSHHILDTICLFHKFSFFEIIFLAFSYYYYINYCIKKQERVIYKKETK